MKATAFLSLALATFANAASPDDWRGRTIYQVITDRFARSDGSTTYTCNSEDRAYCGGTWQGLIQHLDYIQGLGITAVWISPVTQNIQGNTGDGYAYHGYWQQDLYALNSNFGTGDDLKALSSALHQRSMYLMVDIVVNNMAWPGSADTVDFSSFTPFNSSSYFHSYCAITTDDYSSHDSNVEKCWLGDNVVALADLNSEDSYVQNTFNSWISNLVSTYGIDGLRLDAGKHVPNSFWASFTNAAGVYTVSEYYDGSAEFACSNQGSTSGILNYPLYFDIAPAFSSTSGSIVNLVNQVNAVKATCPDSTLIAPFLENQDVPRFPSLTSDTSLLKNAVSFALLADGPPVVYAGQEQRYAGADDPYNREAIWLSGYSQSSEMYTFIAGILQLRNHAVYANATSYLSFKANPVYWDNSVVAVRKGFEGNQIIGVFNNQGSGGSSYTLNLRGDATGFSAGEQIVETISCKTYTTDQQTGLDVQMGAGMPLILYPLAQLTGTGICGH
ncbi:MAG: hypothetical protein Q9227_007218 [Pyrenula ochraceoflavens]